MPKEKSKNYFSFTLAICHLVIQERRRNYQPRCDLVAAMTKLTNEK